MSSRTGVLSIDLTRKPLMSERATRKTRITFLAAATVLALTVPAMSSADTLSALDNTNPPTDLEQQFTDPVSPADQEVDTFLNDRSGDLRDSYYDSAPAAVEARRSTERYWGDTGLPKPLAQQAIDAAQGTNRGLVKKYVAPVLAAIDANLLNILLGSDGDAGQIAYNLNHQTAVGFDAARELVSGDPDGALDVYVSYLSDSFDEKVDTAVESVAAANAAAVHALAPYAVDARYLVDDLGANVNGPYEALKEAAFVGVKRPGDSQRERMAVLDLRAQDGLLGDAAGAAYNGFGAGLWGAVRLTAAGTIGLVELSPQPLVSQAATNFKQWNNPGFQLAQDIEDSAYETATSYAPGIAAPSYAIGMTAGLMPDGVASIAGRAEQGATTLFGKLDGLIPEGTGTGGLVPAYAGAYGEVPGAVPAVAAGTTPGFGTGVNPIGPMALAMAATTDGGWWDGVKRFFGGGKAELARKRALAQQLFDDAQEDIATAFKNGRRDGPSFHLGAGKKSELLKRFRDGGMNLKELKELREGAMVLEENLATTQFDAYLRSLVSNAPEDIARAVALKRQHEVLSALIIAINLAISRYPEPLRIFGP